MAITHVELLADCYRGLCASSPLRDRIKEYLRELDCGHGLLDETHHEPYCYSRCAAAEALEVLEVREAKSCDKCGGTMDNTEPSNALRFELTALLNRHSQENGSNTPDFILAHYLLRCLSAFDSAVVRREQWYGRDHDD